MVIFADHTTAAIINAPYEKINLTEWLFTLKDEEYQACSASHIAGGSSVSKEGARMSINVELINGNLLVQHYIADIALTNHCRVHSHSDTISPLGKAKLDIIWELKIEKQTAETTTLFNHVMVQATDSFLALLAQNGITDLDAITSGMTLNVAAHNAEETPLFAKDISIKAAGDIWVKR